MKKEKNTNLLSQWLTFKLFGITYLVGKIKFKLLFHGPKWLGKLKSKLRHRRAVPFWISPSSWHLACVLRSSCGGDGGRVLRSLKTGSEKISGEFQNLGDHDFDQN